MIPIGTDDEEMRELHDIDAMSDGELDVALQEAGFDPQAPARVLQAAAELRRAAQVGDRVYPTTFPRSVCPAQAPANVTRSQRGGLEIISSPGAWPDLKTATAAPPPAGPHIPSHKLFRRATSDQMTRRERQHLHECRDCQLYVQARLAVTVCDEGGVELAVAATVAAVRPWQTFWGILSATGRAYRTALLRPREWARAGRGLCSAALLLAKATLFSMLDALLDQFGQRQRSAPKRTIEVMLPSALDWGRGASLVRKWRAASQVREAWRDHFHSVLTFRLDPRVEPDDRDAVKLGFRRVVFEGSVPQFGLLRLQPKRTDEHPAQLVVVLAPVFVHSTAANILNAAARFYRKGHHVLIIDQACSGFTSWWSPHARLTGGWLEGRDVARVVHQLTTQLADRVADVRIVGSGLGLTAALWSLYHAERENPGKHRIVRIEGEAPVTHLGAIVEHVEPSRWSSFFDVWRWDFEVRAFFRLVMDLRTARLGDMPDHRGSMKDQLYRNGIDERDLVLPPHPQRWTEPSGSIPGDLLSAAAVLQGSNVEFRILATRIDPLVPFWHAERLFHVLPRGGDETDKAAYRYAEYADAQQRGTGLRCRREEMLQGIVGVVPRLQGPHETESSH